jgi:hypothetical protein
MPGGVGKTQLVLTRPPGRLPAHGDQPDIEEQEVDAFELAEDGEGSPRPRAVSRLVVTANQTAIPSRSRGRARADELADASADLQFSSTWISLTVVDSFGKPGLEGWPFTLHPSAGYGGRSESG